MGMDRKHIPKVYKCEQCQPRPMKLTKTEAREMQMKALAKLRKEKERRQQRKAKRRDERVKKRMQKKAVLISLFCYLPFFLTRVLEKISLEIALKVD